MVSGQWSGTGMHLPARYKELKKKYVMNDAPAADDAVTTRNIYLNKSTTKKAAVSGNY